MGLLALEEASSQDAWRWRKSTTWTCSCGRKRKERCNCRRCRGRSPCGLEYSIEATLSAPQNHPFAAVAGALNILGEVKYAEDLGAAVLKTDKGRASVFANGHIMIIAGKEEAEELLRDVCQTHTARADVHEMQNLREELPARGDCRG